VGRPGGDNASVFNSAFMKDDHGHELALSGGMFARTGAGEIVTTASWKMMEPQAIDRHLLALSDSEMPVSVRFCLASPVVHG